MVDFDFLPPAAQDADDIMNIMASYLDEHSFSRGAFADLLVAQAKQGNGFGTVVTANEGSVVGLVSSIDLIADRVCDGMLLDSAFGRTWNQWLKSASLCLPKSLVEGYRPIWRICSEQHSTATTLTRVCALVVIMCSLAVDIGLLFAERLANVPIQIIIPMIDALMLELRKITLPGNAGFEVVCDLPVLWPILL